MQKSWLVFAISCHDSSLTSYTSVRLFSEYEANVCFYQQILNGYIIFCKSLISDIYANRKGQRKEKKQNT